MQKIKRKIWILTLFPEHFTPLLECGVIGRALRGESSQSPDIQLKIVNIRNYTLNRYKSVDDTPFGGGAGMVMKVDVLYNALFKGVVQAGGYHSQDFLDQVEVIYPSPRGATWTKDCAQKMASNYFTKSSQKDLVFICGRYEGIDERFLEKYITRYYSLGDYIISGGEIAVMAIIDSTLRYVEGVLGNAKSHIIESFNDSLIEYPQYTRPREFQGQEIPEVLLSGHHQNILNFQEKMRKQTTQKYRPDLWEQYLKDNGHE